MEEHVMSDVTVSVEAVEEVRPAELPADVLDEQLIGQLVDRARASGLQLTGEGGLLQQLTKRVLESALEGGITDHLGCEKHDPAGAGSGNSRNGARSKTVLTDVGRFGSRCRVTERAASSRRSSRSGSGA
jgi:putative transposase